MIVFIIGSGIPDQHVLAGFEVLYVREVHLGFMLGVLLSAWGCWQSCLRQSLRQFAPAPPAPRCCCVPPGLEYESLSGVRCILTPQQLLRSLPKPRQQQQQAPPAAGTEAAAAAGSAAALVASRAVRNLPPPERQQQRDKRGGRQQQQQQVAEAYPAHVSGSCSSGGDDGVGGEGTEQLMQQDLPLFLAAASVPDLTVAHQGAAGPAGKAAAAAGDHRTGDGSAVSLSLLQLQRIYVKTPPAPFVMASQPVIRFFNPAETDSSSSSSSSDGMVSAAGSANSTAAAAAAALHSSGAAAAASSLPSKAAQGADRSSSSSSSRDQQQQVEFSLKDQLVLPPDSLLTLNLPKIYAAPVSWAQAVCPTAAVLAAAAAAASVTSSMMTAAPGGSEMKAVLKQCSEQTLGDDSRLAGDISPAAAAADNSGNDNIMLVPLIPVSAGSSVTTQAAAAATSPGSWTAQLKAGSWLYPLPAPAAPSPAAAAAPSPQAAAAPAPVVAASLA